MKNENEITIKILCEKEVIFEILKNKGFRIVKKFSLEDIYMIPADINIEDFSSREILSKAILIRKINNKTLNIIDKCITFKIKKFDDNGDIISQDIADCYINDINQAVKLFTIMGYVKLMEIIENSVVYEKENFGLSIKDIKDSKNLIEIETVPNNIELNTIEKLKKKLLELNIPIDTSNYFVKKAEIKLDKIKNK